jgi:pre-rRNA-processing protein TSR3
MHLHRKANVPKLYVYLTGQDDPKKCSGARIIRFGLAKPIHHRYRKSRNLLILDPFASQILILSDREIALNNGILVVDCSWKKATIVLTRYLHGQRRKLPILLAANPINYAKRERLSSLEAITAALYILGFKEHAKKIASIIKWGPHFIELNQEPLEEYSKAETIQQIARIESEYY